MKVVIPEFKAKKALSLIDGLDEYGLEVQYDETAREKDSITLNLSEPKQGCACSMLSDNADWNAAIWDLQPAVLQPLSLTIPAINTRWQKGFSFSAEWVSEPTNKTIETTLHELIVLIQSNKIGTRTKYVVNCDLASIYNQKISI